jgi:hypothetical protein
MRRHSIWLGLCIMLALIAVRDSGQAQVPPGNDVATGKGMDEVAYKALAALDARNHVGLWETLAPWRQASIALQHDKFMHADLAEKFPDGHFKEMIDELDPKRMLGIDNEEKLRQLTPAQFFALFSGLLVNELAPDASARADWFMVDRIIGLSPGDNASRMRREMPLMMVMPWIGAARFENRLGHSVQMQFAPTEEGWVVIDFVLERNDESVWLSQFSAIIDGADPDVPYSGPSQARQAEGQQLLGTLRNQARVQYARMGVAPSTFTECRVEPRYREGQYYEALDTIHVLTGSEYAAAALARPKTRSDPWLVMRFNWEDGRSDFSSHRTKEAAEAALKKEK